MRIKNNNSTGYVLELDLEYPRKLIFTISMIFTMIIS